MKTSKLLPFTLAGGLTVTAGNASALQFQILSLAPNGTLVWTNDETNVSVGLQFATGLNQPWNNAPAPFNSLLATNYQNSVQLPLANLGASFPQLFFRLASTNAVGGADTYDVNSNGIPLLVQSDYIELAKITTISKFRSGEGHDYSDDFEHCRSMKHYFVIDPLQDATQVRIFSPVTGTVVSESLETKTNSGTQIWITPTNYPAFTFILFHVNVTNTVPVGTTVTNGQQLGWFGGTPGGVTSSDITVKVNTPGGTQLLSYFDLMSPALFANYQDRGVTNTAELIITKEDRDAHPLECAGERFVSPGDLVNEVDLNEEIY